MQTAVNIAGVIGGFGTLIVAWLVYQFGRQQAAQNDARAERQLFLDQQSLRLSMLDRRMKVLSDVQEVWTDYMMHARPQPAMVSRLINAVQEARLIYDDDLLGDLDAVTNKLMLLARNSARQDQARSDEKEYGKLLEKQFGLEDELWPVLTPLVDRMRAATRVRERV